MAETRPENAEEEAEFLATQEAASALNTQWSLLARMGEIQRQQFEWLLEDSFESMRKLSMLENPFLVWTDHWSRRMEHQRVGFESFFAALNDEVATADDRHDWLWSRGNPSRKEDQRTASLLDRLHVDHRRMAHVLEALEQLVAEDAEVDFEKLFAVIDYVVDYPDAVHHPLEDRVFAQLLESDDVPAEEKETIRSNAAAHQKLASATHEMLQMAEALLEGELEMSDELRGRIRDYLHVQREHMRFEEGTVFPIAEKRLTDADWVEIKEADMATHDPMFDQQLTRFASLHDFVTGHHTD